ncbi:peptide chain release factor N(5)-glutamine methyltransferase [Desulfuribacillus alkaliarsenatis]|uniref:peptide chain release factor N(5)-glutamine methyltransferase n=1 Tax=Desulfuribacillus alkaliarsenatis TaxID=766136 RepID=UPI0009FC8E48|nr:peptide chain release factor N(5)-glutamine methyltransferase [Desulfuribacillus alkaliarsenatis]
MNTPKTYREAFNWASSFLTTKKTKNPLFEAELLLRKAAKLERHKLFMSWDEQIDEGDWHTYYTWIKQRGEHVPVQYLTQEQEFYGRTFYVDKRVLIPRPETEILVEQALKRIHKLYENSCNNNTQQISILDIGTGSGAIPITIAAELLNWLDSSSKQAININIDGLDISESALQVAKINAKLLLSAKSSNVRVEWHLGDTWSRHERQYQVILSNPPYVDRAESDTMDREVKDYEPELALFAEEEGLAIYKKIISQANQYLTPAGWLGFEIGYQQSEVISELLQKHNFKNIEVYKDLAGHQRVIFGQRQNI